LPWRRRKRAPSSVAAQKQRTLVALMFLATALCMQLLGIGRSRSCAHSLHWFGPYANSRLCRSTCPRSSDAISDVQWWLAPWQRGMHVGEPALAAKQRASLSLLPQLPVAFVKSIEYICSGASPHASHTAAFTSSTRGGRGV